MSKCESINFLMMIGFRFRPTTALLCSFHAMSNNIDWEDLFGSDDDSDKEVEEREHAKPIITFEAIPGLKLIKQALSHQEQMSLTHALIDRNFFTGNANQAMLFGELPDFIKWVEPWISDNYPDLFGQDIMHRQPLFDQAILNMYKKGKPQ